MTGLKKWELLDKKDISPSHHFPLEKRKYKLPNGTIVDDFYVTTLADSVHIIPITTENKIIMIRMYKQGVDDFIIQFPAGRVDSKHIDFRDAAFKELEEETGIKTTINELQEVGKFALGSTKATEIVHFYMVKNISIYSEQKLDLNEEIEVLSFTADGIDNAIINGKIWCGPTIAGWYLFKSKFPELLI